MLNRRGFLTGLIAAPAVIRVAPLMRVAPLPLVGWEEIVEEVTFARGGSLLTISQITREAIRMFRDTNSFLQSIDEQYAVQTSAPLGSARIVLPPGFKPLAI